MSTTMNITIKNVVKTTAQWAASPTSTTTIPEGVICVEIDTNNKSWIKVGNGTSTYSQLPYITDGAIASLGQFMRLKGIVATVQDLPDGTTGHEREIGDVYLVGTATSGKNDFEEYVFVENGATGTSDWEKLGALDVTVPVYGASSTGGLSLNTNPTTQVQEFSITAISGLSDNTTTSTTGSSSSSYPTATSFGDTINGITVTNNSKGQITAIGNTYFSLPNNTFSAETAASAGDNTKGLVQGPTYANRNNFLKGDGTWAVPDAGVTDVTVDGTSVVSSGTAVLTTFSGAGQSTAGSKGLVPAPTSGTTNAYLKSDGTWATPNTTLSNDSNLVTSGAVYAVVGNINTVLESVL